MRVKNDNYDEAFAEGFEGICKKAGVDPTELILNFVKLSQAANPESATWGQKISKGWQGLKDKTNQGVDMLALDRVSSNVSPLTTAGAYGKKTWDKIGPDNQRTLTWGGIGAGAGALGGLAGTALAGDELDEYGRPKKKHYLRNMLGGAAVVGGGAAAAGKYKNDITNMYGKVREKFKGKDGKEEEKKTAEFNTACIEGMRTKFAQAGLDPSRAEQLIQVILAQLQKGRSAIEPMLAQGQNLVGQGQAAVGPLVNQGLAQGKEYAGKGMDFAKEHKLPLIAGGAALGGAAIGAGAHAATSKKKDKKSKKEAAYMEGMISKFAEYGLTEEQIDAVIKIAQDANLTPTGNPQLQLNSSFGDKSITGDIPGIPKELLEALIKGYAGHEGGIRGGVLGGAGGTIAGGVTGALLPPGIDPKTRKPKSRWNKTLAGAGIGLGAGTIGGAVAGSKISISQVTDAINKLKQQATG